jgi:hypothetical protein
MKEVVTEAAYGAGGTDSISSQFEIEIVIGVFPDAFQNILPARLRGGDAISIHGLRIQKQNRLSGLRSVEA